jgi:hypothetical protein
MLILFMLALKFCPYGFEDAQGFHAVKNFESAPAITPGAKLVGERIVNPDEPTSPSNGAGTVCKARFIARRVTKPSGPDIVPASWIRKWVRLS